MWFQLRAVLSVSLVLEDNREKPLNLKDKCFLNWEYVIIVNKGFSQQIIQSNTWECQKKGMVFKTNDSVVKCIIKW